MEEKNQLYKNDQPNYGATSGFDGKELYSKIILGDKKNQEKERQQEQTLNLSYTGHG